MVGAVSAQAGALRSAGLLAWVASRYSLRSWCVRRKIWGLLGFGLSQLFLGGVAGLAVLFWAAGIGWLGQGEAEIESTAYRPRLRAGEGVEARNCPAWGRDDGVRGQVRGAMTDAFRWSRVLPGFTCGRGLRLGPSCASHRCRRRLVMEMLASPAPPGLDRGAGGKVVTVPSVLVRSWFPRTRWL